MSVPATHFSTLEQQAQAARFGTLVFLASELLLFAGLFALWASYRAEWPAEFQAAARGTSAALGLADTLVLLTASFLAALSLHAFRGEKTQASARLLGVAALLGALFLVLKIAEWTVHLQHGLAPGAHLGRGTQLFWTLYFTSTGLHALHATIGIGVLAAMAFLIGRGRLALDRAYVLENAASYWHLVDAIWLLLWPMFYLLRGGA